MTDQNGIILKIQKGIENTPSDVRGNYSDGYHTFNELYEFRHLLFIKVVKSKKEIAFKTLKNKEGQSSEGWFILGLNTDNGQITFHLPIRLWHEVSDIKEIERNFLFDGHNSDDVLVRLNAL
jgi:hypothetical protein